MATLRHGPPPAESARRDPKRSQTGQNGTKRSQTIPNGPIRPQTERNESKRPDGAWCKPLLDSVLGRLWHSAGFFQIPVSGNWEPETGASHGRHLANRRADAGVRRLSSRHRPPLSGSRIRNAIRLSNSFAALGADRGPHSHPHSPRCRLRAQRRRLIVNGARQDATGMADTFLEILGWICPNAGAFARAKLSVDDVAWFGRQRGQEPFRLAAIRWCERGVAWALGTEQRIGRARGRRKVLADFAHICRIDARCGRGGTFPSTTVLSWGKRL